MKRKRANGARAQARLHRLHTRLASGLLPALDQVPSLALSPELGSRGESALHWFALHGRVDLVVSWIKSGGPIIPDQDGRGPWHWALAATIHDKFSYHPMMALLAAQEVIDALRPSASWIDNQGRDALGLMCLMERPGLFAEFARAHPEVAASGLSLGLNGRVACIDAWIGSVGVENRDLNILVDAIGDLLGAPSEELPEPMRGGVWTPELWRLALRARLPDELWSRREAQAIDDVLSGTASSLKKSARI